MGRAFARDVLRAFIAQGPHIDVMKETLAWAKERAKTWMKVLDEKLIGPKNAYLCGDKLTIADY